MMLNYIEWAEFFGILLFGWVVCRSFGIPHGLCRFWTVAWLVTLIVISLRVGGTVDTFATTTLEWLVSTQEAPVRYAFYAATIAWILSWGGSIGGNFNREKVTK